MANTDMVRVRPRGAGYLLTFAPPLILMASAWAGQTLGNANVWAFLPLVVVYALVPAINTLLPQSKRRRHDPEAVRSLESNRWYPTIVLLVLPVQIVTLIVATAHFVSGKLQGVGALAWVLSSGVCSALFAINAAHELMHSRRRARRALAGALLSTVYFATFKVVHLRVHHRHVGTDVDFESARRGQSLYAFWLQALRGHARVLTGRCDGVVLNKRAHRECLAWYCLGVAATAAVAIAWSAAAAIFLLAQGLVAILKLEWVNYLQHYGLRRNVDSAGRAERVAPGHAWSQEHWVTNLALLNLMYHADHHLNPNKPYQVLEPNVGSPAYRYDFSLMLMLALLPPMFYKLVHPHLDRRIDAHPRKPDTCDRPRADGRSAPKPRPARPERISHRSTGLTHTLRSDP